MNSGTSSFIRGSWVMRVDLHLPKPDEMLPEMLEMAAAVAWANYQVEGRGCLWLQVNVDDVPGYMYLPDIKLRQSPNRKPCHPDVETYDPVNEILLSVTPNWEVFHSDLIGNKVFHFNYRVHVKDKVGKSCFECWELWGERLGEVELEGILMAVD